MTDDRERWAVILGASSGMGEATAKVRAASGSPTASTGSGGRRRRGGLLRVGRTSGPGQDRGPARTFQSPAGNPRSNVTMAWAEWADMLAAMSASPIESATPSRHASSQRRT